MREESESGIRKWEEMWFKTTAAKLYRESGKTVAAALFWGSNDKCPI